MSLIVVDVEADGPIAGEYSIVCFGAVVVDHKLDKTFYGKMKPITRKWYQDALAISGFSRDEHLEFDDPYTVMSDFNMWIKSNSIGQPKFISDNPAFDWQFINYYFHVYLNKNPFGFSARRIGDLYSGLVKDGRAQWKHLRKTKHDHNPVSDAKGNAEALLKIQEMGVKLGIK